MKILSSIMKDQKVIFRSWKSVIILVLGPLIVALLLAMSFSTSDTYSLKLGMVYEGDVDTSFFNSLNGKMDMITFNGIEPCLSATMKQEIHGCIKVTQTQGASQVTFYLDHSRDQLSYLILNYIEGALREYLQSIMSQEKLEEISSIKSGMLQETGSFRSDLFSQGSSIRQMSSGVESSVSSTRDEITYTRNDINSFNSDINQKINERLNKLYSIDNTLYTMQYRVSSINFNVYSSQGIDITPITSLQRDMLQQIASARAEVGSEINNLNSMRYECNENTQKFNNRLNNAESELNNVQQQKYTLDNLASSLDQGAYKVTDLENSLNNMFSSSLLNFKEYNLKVEELKFNLPDVQGSSASTNLIRGLFPVVLVMMLIFISVVFSNIITKNEMNSPAYIRWRLSPTPIWVNTLGMMVSTVFLVLIQVGVLLMAGNTIFLIDYSYNLWGIMVVLLFNIVFYASLGVITSLLIKNDNASLLSAIFVVISFYVVSGILLPLERTGTLMNFFQYLPSSIMLSMLRKMILYGVDLFASMQQFTILAIETGIALLMTMIIATLKK